jgi:2-phospho-L-lactate guanylyltransferase (CobY/MobA/RfbA family)
MDALQIVEAIKQRRDLVWDRQVLGTASDLPLYSEAELARAIADEYDSLLVQLGAITPQQAKSA